MRSELLLSALAAIAGWGIFEPAHAAIQIPGADGSDGVFAPTEDTTIDLGEATKSAWDATSPSPGKGVYDPDKWAVVFKYSSVEIPEGVTVSFSNHPSGAPVVWMVSGDMTVDGLIWLGGEDDNGLVTQIPAGGPGGFRGGRERFMSDPSWNGFGPGGGDHGGNSGSYGTDARSPSYGAYGNDKLIPLIGGSGGGAWSDLGNGGAGGGAMLAAVAGELSVGGRIAANGAPGESSSGGGSGGAVRLVCDTVSGVGMIQAIARGSGGSGRLRLETNSAASAIGLEMIPFTRRVPVSDPVQLWPKSESPSARIVSVGAVDTPADSEPEKLFGGGDADVELATSDAVDVLIETLNMPTDSRVNLRLQRFSGGTEDWDATHVIGDFAQSTWIVENVELPQASMLHVRATSN